MSLQDIITLNITTTTVARSRASFGVPLLLACHAIGAPTRVQSFSTLSEAVLAGHVAGSHVHRALTSMFSQNPRPPVIKVGRRALNHTQTLRLTPVVTTTGFVYTFVIDGIEFSYTVLAAATVATIVTALTSLINATAVTMTATDATTHVTLVSDVAGIVHSVTKRTPSLAVADLTTNPGIATDYAACQLEDPNYYIVLLDSNSEAEIAALAAIIETEERLLVVESSDTTCESAAVTDDVLSDLAAAGYALTIPLFRRDLGAYAAAGWAAGRSTADPGSDTWAFKAIRGAAADNLTSTVRTAIEGKSANHYTDVGGASITRYGVSSAGEYADVSRGVHWFSARLRERILSVLINRAKVPFTDAGADLFRAEILAQIEVAIAQDFIADDPDDQPIVTVPAVADVDAADRAARFLPGIEFSARIAGAIHKLSINGRLGA